MADDVGSKPVLRVEGVNQYYGGSHILRNLSFDDADFPHFSQCGFVERRFKQGGAVARPSIFGDATLPIVTPYRVRHLLSASSACDRSADASHPIQFRSKR